MHDNQRKLSMKVNNAQLSQATEEKNNWTKKQLQKLWGDNQADYFTNPARLVNKQENQSAKDDSPTHKERNVNIETKRDQKGLYAYSIWDSIREDSNNKLKTFDLDKELQQTMEIMKRNKKNTISKEEEEEEINKIIRPTDMSRVKQARIYRNELELMYRSSKMNEEKVNFLKITSAPLDLNDQIGKQSIIKYLPGIDLHDDYKQPKVNSSLEFLTSPLMKNKYKRQMEEKQSQKSDSLDYTVVGMNMHSNRSKIEAQNVKLKFLEEKSYKSYLESKTELQDVLETTVSKSLNERSNFFEYGINENKITSSIYPPLTLNALMEYKPLVKAPGYGNFENDLNTASIDYIQVDSAVSPNEINLYHEKSNYFGDANKLSLISYEQEDDLDESSIEELLFSLSTLEENNSLDDVSDPSDSFCGDLSLHEEEEYIVPENNQDTCFSSQTNFDAILMSLFLRNKMTQESFDVL
ncbi:unnamed protein product [Brachionus calyciflorus]|uniref:Uncharacterized protein n=1 Tax=Brachionus calyciflorus TaxID=104777 RepID=A0A814B693_9BILA|nr:unnamed protein product [Brachionus calyciflorus]